MSKIPLLLAILLLGLVLRVININQSLWLDEAAQVIESSRPLSRQLVIAGDFQPPLFHLVLHFWMRLGGTSEIWMRLLTVLISTVSIYIFYLICKKTVNKKFAKWCACLMSINPFLVYYSQELRPYPLTVLLALLTQWGLIKKSSFLLIVSLTLFLYSTYFAPFFILANLIFIIFWRKNLTKWYLKNVLVSILLFIPWLGSFLQQLTIGTSLTNSLPGWGEAVSTSLVKAFPLTFAKFTLGRISIDNKIIYMIVVGFVMMIFGYNLIIHARKKKFLFMVSLFIIPVFLALVTHIFIPIYDPKRLLFITPFFIATIVFGFLNIGYKRRILFTILFFSTSIYGLFTYFTNTRFQRENWRGAVSFIESVAKPEDIVLFSFPQPFAPYLWYQQKNLGYGVNKNMVINNSDIISLRQVLTTRQTVFYFQYLSKLTDPQDRIPQTLLEQGFVLIKTYDYQGVGFIYIYENKSLALAS